MGKEKLIKEELKRHMELLEYTFYMEEPKEEDENLLLGALDSLNEQDPVPGDEETMEDPFATDTTGDTEETEESEETEETEEEVGTDPFGGDQGMEVEDEFADEAGEETVEVDVTDIVDKAEQTRTEIEDMTAKMDEL